MRVLLIIVGIVLALALGAAPSDRLVAGAPDAPVYAAIADATNAFAPHCDHFPCSDAAHAHAPCVCAFAFVSGQALGPADVDFTFARIWFSDDSITGRTLLPPVPPPLA